MSEVFRVANKFYLNNYSAKDGVGRRLLGVVGMLDLGQGFVRTFVTHLKNPEKHFYRKGRGYPLNVDLLKMLEVGGIQFVVIPEDGKTGFYINYCSLERYLKGEVVERENGENQRCVPLCECIALSASMEQVKRFLYR